MSKERTANVIVFDSSRAHRPAAKSSCACNDVADVASPPAPARRAPTFDEVVEAHKTGDFSKIRHPVTQVELEEALRREHLVKILKANKGGPHLAEARRELEASQAFLCAAIDSGLEVEPGPRSVSIVERGRNRRAVVR